MDQKPHSATILVVDDDQGLVRLIEKSLRRSGFATAAATSGRAALDWLKQARADLALVDLQLQDISGQDLLKHLAEANRSVPFIIITGQGDERVAVEMMKRGAVDYLVKDKDFLEVVPDVVRHALAQLEKEKRLAAMEEALRASEERFRIVLKNSPIVAFHQDKNLRYIWIHNPIGHVEADVVGKTDADLFSPEEAGRLTRLKRRVLESRVGLREEVDCTLGGTLRTLDLTVEPMRDAGGGIVGITCAAMDVTERKQLQKEILKISELEQHRIGQDLHDGLCQHLAGIELMSQVLEQTLAKKTNPAAGQAAKIAQHVREAMTQTRLLAHGLSPVALESEGLRYALQELATTTEKLFHIACSFRCDSPVLLEDNVVATHLYRIAQEAVSNAIKHGKSQHVEMGLARTERDLRLTVKDDGAGFPEVLPKHHGLGLRIMRYRAGMIGASVTVKRGPDGGTIVLCSIDKSAESSFDSAHL